MIQHNDALSLFHIPYFLQSGTGIIIKSRNEFASHILPIYFNTQEFASFHRQLTNCKYACNQFLHTTAASLVQKNKDFIIKDKRTQPRVISLPATCLHKPNDSRATRYFNLR